MFMYVCLCLNDDSVAAVLHSLSTSTIIHRCLPKVVSHFGLNAPIPLPTLPFSLSLLGFRMKGSCLLCVSSGSAKHNCEKDGGPWIVRPAPFCGAGVRRSPLVAMPRQSHSSYRTHAALLPAGHCLPQLQRCLSQPGLACRFPPGKGLTARSPGRKKVSAPFLPINAPFSSPAVPILLPPGIGCRTIHWLLNSGPV